MTMPGIDEPTARAVLATGLSDNQDICRWFTMVREVCADSAADSELDALVEQIREAARGASFDDAVAEAFAREVLAGGDRRVVEQAGLLDDRMPALYWELHEQWQGGDPGSGDPQGGTQGGDRFDWLSGEQRGRLEQTWGPSWSGSLEQWLDQRWGPGWDQHPAEHKRAWLDDLLKELGSAADSGEPADPCSWVTAEQRSRLASARGENWPQFLQQALDSQWGAGWEAHPDDHKAAWLDQLIPSLTEGSQPATADAAAAPAAGQASHEELLEQAFSMALDQVPGARDLPSAEIERLRLEFRGEYERTHPLPDGKEAGQ